jgi:hypothetical protein
VRHHAISVDRPFFASDRRLVLIVELIGRD